jgi:hypothetical protein
MPQRVPQGHESWWFPQCARAFVAREVLIGDGTDTNVQVEGYRVYRYSGKLWL